MIVIIAGSRSVTDYGLVLDLVAESGFEVTEVISGCAPGVDTAALMKPWSCPVRRMPANWRPGGRYDPSAGFRRNAEMEKVGEALVAIWDGKSRGTRNMIELFRGTGKPYVICRGH